MSAMEESLEGLRKEVAELEQEETKMRSQEVDIKHEVEKYETVLKENQQKVKHWQKEVCYYCFFNKMAWVIDSIIVNQYCCIDWMGWINGTLQ